MRLKRLFHCLFFALAVLTMSLPSQAGMVGTAQIQVGTDAIEFGNIVQQRDWIKEQLVLGGVSETDAVSRVAAMTDVEVTQIHQRIDEAPVGGADVLVIGLIIFAVLEITGYIDVIPEQ